jgi:membrane protease YdiL (CAAX protease family)
MTVGAVVPFLAIAFGLAWGLIAVLILFTAQVEAVFGPVGYTNPLFVLAVYAPAIAGLSLVWWHDGVGGLGRYLRRLALWRMPLAWWAFLVLGIPAVKYLGAAMGGTLATSFPFSPWYAVVPALATAALIGPMEELGWRGLALPLLQRRFAPLGAGLILGAIWGLWHAPSFVLAGSPQSAWALGPYVLGVLSLSVILTPMFNAARGSILIPALFHFQMNGPAWPEAQPYENYLFALVAAAVVVLNRRSMFTRDAAVTAVLLPADGSETSGGAPREGRPAASPRASLPPTGGRTVLGVAGTVVLVLAAGALGTLVVLRVVGDRAVDRVWADLERTRSTGQVFSAAMVADLPDPARRYFLHAIRPGTPLAARVRLTQTGSLRIGEQWAAFTAEEVLVGGTARPGFAWTVRSRLGGLPLTGSDHYADGRGRTRMLVVGLLPVVDEASPDLARSAGGRLVGEYMWLPSAWLPRAGTAIEPVDADRFAVVVATGGETTRLTLTVDERGRLIDLSFPRYGDHTPEERFQYIPFGGPYDPSAERTFDGYTIPTQIRAGWWYGTPRYQETFRIDVTGAAYG